MSNAVSCKRGEDIDECKEALDLFFEKEKMCKSTAVWFCVFGNYRNSSSPYHLLSLISHQACPVVNNSVLKIAAFPFRLLLYCCFGV